jgi:hypothetical protein
MAVSKETYNQTRKQRTATMPTQSNSIITITAQPYPAPPSLEAAAGYGFSTVAAPRCHRRALLCPVFNAAHLPSSPPAPAGFEE